MRRGERIIQLEQDWDGAKQTIAQLEAELAECRRQINEGIGAMFRIECDLGMALYGTGEDSLPLWGEHTAETLAMEAAKRLKGKGDGGRRERGEVQK